MIIENLSTLKIHEMKSKEQYKKVLSEGNIDPNAIYLTPDEEMEIDNMLISTPEMYGAVGDGIADDTEALQNVLSNNNYVIFGCGKTYLITETITLRSPQFIDLNGSTIQLSENVNSAFTSLNSSIGNITIKNGTILGTKTEIPVAFLTSLEEYRASLVAEGRTETEISSLCMQYIEKIDPSMYQCGIRIASYQSHYENLKFRKLDIGLYFDKRKNGNEKALNENKVLHCKFASCYLASIYSTSTCKNADGIMDDVTYSAGAIYGIYYGCSGGWTFQNLHMYGEFDYALCLKGMDSTTVDGLRCLGHAKKITVYCGVYSSGQLVNCRLTATESGSTIIHADKNALGSGDYFGDDRPLTLSNINFTVLGKSKEMEDMPKNIIPISGNANFVGSNIFYNDPYGSFLPNTANITDVQSGMINNVELLGIYEINSENEAVQNIDIATFKKSYRKVILIMENITKEKSGAYSIKIDSNTWLTSNSTSSADYAIEIELFNNNLINAIMGTKSVGTRYGGWYTNGNNDGLFKTGSLFSIYSNVPITNGKISLYAVE